MYLALVLLSLDSGQLSAFISRPVASPLGGNHAFSVSFWRYLFFSTHRLLHSKSCCIFTLYALLVDSMVLVLLPLCNPVVPTSGDVVLPHAVSLKFNIFRKSSTYRYNWLALPSNSSAPNIVLCAEDSELSAPECRLLGTRPLLGCVHHAFMVPPS